MHFPYYVFIKNQWFEKLTKGTALGGLSPPVHLPTPIKKPLRKMSQLVFEVELNKSLL